MAARSWEFRGVPLARLNREKERAKLLYCTDDAGRPGTRSRQISLTKEYLDSDGATAGPVPVRDPARARGVSVDLIRNLLLAAKAPYCVAFAEKDGGKRFFGYEALSTTVQYRRIPGAAAPIRSGFTRLCRLPYTLSTL